MYYLLKLVKNSKKLLCYLFFYEQRTQLSLKKLKIAINKDILMNLFSLGAEFLRPLHKSSWQQQSLPLVSLLIDKSQDEFKAQDFLYKPSNSCSLCTKNIEIWFYMYRKYFISSSCVYFSLYLNKQKYIRIRNVFLE